MYVWTKISPSCTMCLLMRQKKILTQRYAHNWKNSSLYQWRRDNKNIFGPKLSAKQVAKRKYPAYQTKLVHQSRGTNDLVRWKYENELLYGPLLTSSSKHKSNIFETQNSSSVYCQLDGAPLEETTVTSMSLASIAEPEDVHTAEVAELDTSGIDPILLFPLLRISEQDASEMVSPVPGVHLPLMGQQRFPSVTHILKETMSPENATILQRWEERMIDELGKEGFQEYRRNLFEKGNNLHECIEQYLHGCSEEELPLSAAASSHWHSMRPLLQHVEDVKKTELAVTHQQLEYTGIFDCLAKYKNQLCVIEWKTSTKRKSSLRATFDNPLQLAAYVGALNYDRKLPIQVDSALLVISYEDGSPAHAHLLSRSQLQMYWDKWLQRLHSYWCMQVSKEAAKRRALQR